MNVPYNGKITYGFIRGLYISNGYTFNECDKYKVNLFGIRNKSEIIDAWNDLLGVAYTDEFGNTHCLVFRGTTKPGLTYLKDKLGNKDGTAILQPGQHKNCWVIGTHNKGTEHEHESYVQSGSGVFKVWRDNNSDGKLDTDGKTWLNVSGLNGHRARIFDVSRVGSFSASCQVMFDDKEHAIWVSLGKRCIELYNTKLDYTLFQEI